MHYISTLFEALHFVIIEVVFQSLNLKNKRWTSEQLERYGEKLRFLSYPLIRQLAPLFVPFSNMGTWRLIEYLKTIQFLRLNRKDMILDLGSDESSFPFFLLKDGYSVACVDINKNSIKNHLSACKLCEFQGEYFHILADVRKLPFKHQSFDKISAISVLEHVKENDWLVSKEIGRVLKDGGICVLTFPFSANPREAIDFNSPLCVQRRYTEGLIKEKIITPSRCLHVLEKNRFW